MSRLLLIIALLFALGAPAFAVEPDEMLDDPVLEARARAISAGLRCLVCQNQSIDDSDAELAGDLRVLVRQRLVAGDTDQDVFDYIVARFGEFVLLRPPFDIRTYALWFGAPLVFLAVAVGLAAGARRLRRQKPPPALDGEERASLDRLVGGQG
jgi:cytochrome c-type biogenesis protein CcmH